MSNASHVMRIEFETGCANSDGEIIKGTERDVCILYNETVITEDEVIALIHSREYEYDNRVIVTTPIQADNLKDKKENE